MADLIERLNKTAIILETQADLAQRIADTYSQEREQWEKRREGGKTDERLTQMIGYQLDQERLARSLVKDAKEVREAATRLAEVEAERDGLRAALESVVDPLAYLRRMAEASGNVIDGHGAYNLSNDVNFLKNLARAALGAKPGPARQRGKR